MEKATEKKTRTPRNFETILKGALQLTLKEKVDLRNQLSAVIGDEVAKAKEAAKEAEKIAGV